MKSKKVTIQVDALARVEGEGGLSIMPGDGEIPDVQFRIYEPPRFFEAFLKGRSYREVPDITARICGICPIAYQMSAVHAIEDAFGIQVTEPIRSLRRLVYCGEWIESHGLHVYMLHAPDFLGYADALEMAKDHPEAVQRGLQLKKAGNELVRLIGGREIHPVNVRVGGFYKVPTKQELAPLSEKLERARDLAVETVSWVAAFPFPDFENDYEFVAVQHSHEYPFNEGGIVSSRGTRIPVRHYDDHFVEDQVSHSTALHSELREGSAFLVGPLARYNLNFDRLSPLAQEAARSAGLSGSCFNPFQSIIVRAVETLYACDEALRIIENYEMPQRPAVEVNSRAATGFACTEAPRGALYHRYRFDSEGIVLDAKIVPPTAQNQKTIEQDVLRVARDHAALPKQELTWLCEQAIRNYDPCISCATHVMKRKGQP